ncbi:SDR family oxidoreductase [Streptomyces sp. NPDC052396]|uniref:SDR family oxidoreductase n=1 Tax=Streptomyces sp. NPDC052396 TaxID=3365689 RepID=UPI0037D77A3D
MPEKRTLVLQGRTALVTGGSRGIGRSVVRRLTADGAAVAFGYVRSEDAARLLAEEVAAEGGQAHAIAADLTQLAGVRRVFDEAEQRLGGVDILVNNAGESLVAAIADTSEEDFDRVMAVNAKAAFFLIQEAARRLRRDGRIINVSSVNTVLHAPGIAVYAAAKAAVEQFTLVAARELGVRGITVNTVSPGPVDTDMLRAAQSAEALDRAAAMTPLRRIGRPEDIADVIAFLAGPDARWVNGQNLRATGGLG